MIGFSRSAYKRWQVKPTMPQLNLGHPLIADGRLVRAMTYADGHAGTGSAGLIRDMVTNQLVTQNSLVIDDLMGSVASSTGSANAGSFVDSADLTPTTSVGNGGWTIASGIWLNSNSVANQIAHKYQTSHLEWIHGLASTTLYYWLYDNTAAAYIGRTAPAPTAGVWHNVVATWDGSAASSGVKIWVDAIRVDSADFASGAFVQVRDTTATALIGSTNSGLGGTTNMRFNYVYFFRRGLLPDEVAWLHEDPSCFLAPPHGRCLGAPGAAAPGRQRFFFFP